MADRRTKLPDDEAAFLDDYRPADFPRPSVAVDLVILTIEDCDLRLLTVLRNEHPFKGKWALPGGFLRVGPSRTDQGEGLDEAAALVDPQCLGMHAGQFGGNGDHVDRLVLRAL